MTVSRRVRQMLVDGLGCVNPGLVLVVRADRVQAAPAGRLSHEGAVHTGRQSIRSPALPAAVPLEPWTRHEAGNKGQCLLPLGRPSLSISMAWLLCSVRSAAGLAWKVPADILGQSQTLGPSSPASSKICVLHARNTRQRSASPVPSTVTFIGAPL